LKRFTWSLLGRARVRVGIVLLQVVVWREFKETLRDKSLLSSVFSVFAFLGMLSATTVKLPISVESIVFHMAPCLGIIVGFGLSTRFVREKQEGTVETLLCTPLTLRELWLGKVVSLTIPSYIVSVVSTLAFISLRGYTVNALMAVYLAMVVPVVIASATGLLGFLYYILGMRQVRILNYIVFFTLFATLYLVVGRLASPTILTWRNVSIVLALSLVTFGITYYQITHLSRERIVTTIS